MAQDRCFYFYGISRGRARIGENESVFRHLLRKKGPAVSNSTV